VVVEKCSRDSWSPGAATPEPAKARCCMAKSSRSPRDRKDADRPAKPDPPRTPSGRGRRRSGAAFTTSANGAAGLTGNSCASSATAGRRSLEEYEEVAGNQHGGSASQTSSGWEVVSEKDRPELPNCRPFSSAAPVGRHCCRRRRTPEASWEATQNCLGHFLRPDSQHCRNRVKMSAGSGTVSEAPSPMRAYQ
jgi:hypothetical protein